MGKKVPIILLGGELVDDGRKLGPQAMERCAEAMMFYRHLVWFKKEEALIITSAGIDPVEGRNEAQSVPLSEMMAERLITEWEIPLDDIRTNIDVWGSRAEIHEALRFINESPDDFEGYGYVISHRYHHPRLRLILRRRARALGLEMDWEFTGPKGPFRSVLNELYKVPGEALLGALHRS